jgi:hypothetical protein
MEERNFICPWYILFFRLAKDKAAILKKSKKDKLILGFGGYAKLLENVVTFLLNPLQH